MLEAKGVVEAAGPSSFVMRGALLKQHVVAQAEAEPDRLYIDEETAELWQGPSIISTLTNLERKALAYLLARPRLRVSKTELIEGVWPEDVTKDGVMDDALYQVVRGIRCKIETDPSRPCYLVTWRGRPEGGYQLFPDGRP